MTKNPFAIFPTDTKKAVIEALEGAEIEYRELTMAEEDKFQKMLIKGFDAEGNPELDTDSYMDIKYAKVSTCLINPEMSVAELKALPNSASKAISEILTVITGRSEEDNGGNED